LVRNAFFFAFARLFGMQAQFYFAFILSCHLLNVVLLSTLIHRLTNSPALACFGSALWGMAAVHRGTLEWISVFGQVLVATALLIVLLRLARLPDGARLRLSTTAWCWLLLVCASASFGSGIGIAISFPLVVWILIGSRGWDQGTAWVMVAIPLTVIVLYGLEQHHFQSTFVGTKEAAQFMQPYFLIIQPQRWTSMLTMWVHLVARGVGSPIVGMVTPDTPYSPLSVWCASTGSLLLAATAWPRFERQDRRWFGAAALLLCVTYGLVAVARAPEYAMFNVHMQDAAAEGRYHYVGAILSCLMLCLTLNAAGRVPYLRQAGIVALPMVLLLLIVVARRNADAIDVHASEREATRQVLEAIRAEIDGHPPGTQVFIQNQRFAPAGGFRLPNGTVFPGWVGVFEIAFPRNVVRGRRVFFVSSDAAVLEAAKWGDRLQSLVRSPRDAEQPSPARASPPR
jgi:hypothetical protein